MMGAFNKRITGWEWLGAAAVLILLVLLPFVASSFQLRLAQQVLLFGGVALAWSLLGGFTQYWSFGHAAFFGLGAFTAGLLAQALGHGISGPVKLLLGLALAALINFAVAAVMAMPVLRLRGTYFAIAMLALAQVLGEVSKTFDIFQGSMGFVLQRIAVPGLNSVQTFYLLFLLFAVANVAIFVWVKRSRIGMGLTCVGQDEDTAAMLGIPTERYKLLAFVLSAVLTSIGGVLYAYSLAFITTDTVFRIDISLNLILFSMVGGLGTVAGPFIGAAIMIFITQVVLGGLLHLHFLVTGAILVFIVIAAPTGIIGLRNRLPGLARRATGSEART
ncbi:MAG: branched-chain amino acid ABC transporter permease [Rhizobiaceae bacterium]|jgi:branched-chain amino acid transport system permease protein|nr:MAG: branched-chain amino acid ABC transporter permease [Rhizobiaceae bacterium]